MYKNLPQSFFKQKKLISMIAVSLLSTTFVFGEDASTVLDKVEISSNGKGSTRQVESVTAAELSQLPPGSSPMLAVSRLPGVNFQSADTFGSYEWSERISVRGFNQNQLGFTLDDIPLGDMSYGNMNGLHISRAIATENISRASLSAGTGSLSVASSSNLGGTLQFYSVDPAKSSGASFNVGGGNLSTAHLFGKLETGKTDLGQAYVSVTDQQSNKWRGSGQDRQLLLNSKYVNEFGSNKLTAFANASDRREIDYQDLSLDMINKFGYGIDNTYPNIAQAVKIANTAGLCGAPSFATYTAACDYQYYAGSGLRQDQLYGATLKSNISENLNTKASIYHHNDKGAGTWYTPYQASPNGSPISERTTEYSINRSGVLGEAVYSFNEHRVKGAFWYEDNIFNNARRYYSVDPNAPSSPYDFPANPFLTSWQYKFDTKTLVYSLEDTWDITPGIHINYGAKSLKADTTADLQIGDPTARPTGSISSGKPFLPQVGITYDLNSTNELFAAFAQNAHAFQAAGAAGPYSTTAAGFTAIKSSLKPETSSTYEAGWRLNSKMHESVVAIYNVDFKDRQLAIQVGPGIVGNPSVLANVGGARMTGLELSDAWRVGGGYSWYNGLTLNRSVYTSDYVSNGVTYNTNGKTLMDTPTTMFKSILGYDSSEYFGNLGMDYMGSRYYTYSNDVSVQGRTLFNASVGYKLGTVSSLKDMSLLFSVTNLTDQKYIATVGSNGYQYSDPQGTFQTLLPGAPRAVFLSLSGKL